MDASAGMPEPGRSRRTVPLLSLAVATALAAVLALDGKSIAEHLEVGTLAARAAGVLGGALVLATVVRVVRRKSSFGRGSADAALALALVVVALALSTVDLVRTASYLDSGILRILRKVSIVLGEGIAGALVASGLLALREKRSRIPPAIAASCSGLLVLAGILALAEIRVSPRLPDDWYSVETLDGKPAILHRNDREVRWLMKPNFSCRLVHPEFPGVLVRTNSLGFRDLEFDLPGSSEHGRLGLVLGDSFAFGMGVDEADVFARRLESLGVAPRVWNTGVSGFCNLDELVVLDRMLARAKPSLVVVLVYVGNDLEENLQFLERGGTGAARKAFVASLFPDAAKFAEEAVRDDRGPGSGGEAAIRIPSVGKLRYQLEQRSKALRLLFETLDRFAVRIGARPPRPVVNPFQIDTFAPDPSPRVRLAIDLAFETLRAIGERGKAAGARTLVCFAPGKIQVSRTSFLDAVRRAGFDPARCDLDRPQKELVARLRDVGVETLDLMPALRAADAAGERDYYEEGHWNAAGHALAAREVARYLAEHP
jgi:hypothetical protein